MLIVNCQLLTVCDRVARTASVDRLAPLSFRRIRAETSELLRFL